MYENRARLLCAAEGTPVELFDRIVTIVDAQNIASIQGQGKVMTLTFVWTMNWVLQRTALLVGMILQSTICSLFYNPWIFLVLDHW